MYDQLMTRPARRSAAVTKPPLHFGFSAFARHAAATLSLILLANLPANALAQETSGPSHAIAMYGSPAEAEGQPLSYANPQAPQGGRITYGVVGSFDSVNPFILKSIRTTSRGMWDPEFGHLLFQPLMMRSYDEPFTLYGLLAEKAEMPEDRSWIEFSINPNARWHDGEPVTPDDVIFTYDLLKEKGRPPFSSRMNRIEKIEKTGDLKVKFTFNKESNREYPLIVAGFTPVLPKHATNVETFADSTLTPLVGSGPYKVQSIDAGKKIVYEKNPDYWGKDLPHTKGFFNFDEIAIEYFRQDTTLFEAFKKGIIDVYTDGDPAHWQRAYDFEAVTTGEIKKAEFTSGDPANMSGFVFNTRREQFSDPAVREALIRAFDFETVNKNLFFDAYKRTESFWQGSELSAVGRPADEREKELLSGFPEAVQADIMDGSWRLPVTDGRGGDRKVLRDVLQRLTKAGYKREGSQLMNSAGQQFSFEIMTRNVSEEKIALAYQQTLERLGIAVNIRTVDDAQYQQRLNSFDYDMMIGNYSASLSPGIEQNWRWGSEAKGIEGSFNYAGVAEPAIDHVIREMVASRSREDFISSVRALDRLLLSGHYLIPLYHLDKQWVAHRADLAYPDKTPLYGNRFPVWWRKSAQ